MPAIFYMKTLFKNGKREKLSLSVFHGTVLKMLVLVNKDEGYQELLVEDIELSVAKIDSIYALNNCAQKTLLNINPVASC